MIIVAEIVCFIDRSPFTKELDLCGWDFKHSVFMPQACDIGLAVAAKSIHSGGAESSQPR